MTGRSSEPISGDLWTGKDVPVTGDVSNKRSKYLVKEVDEGGGEDGDRCPCVDKSSEYINPD